MSVANNVPVASDFEKLKKDYEVLHDAYINAKRFLLVALSMAKSNEHDYLGICLTEGDLEAMVILLVTAKAMLPEISHPSVLDIPF